MTTDNEELENEELEQGEQIDPELEKEARSMGWRPKDQFPGNPDNWVDAEEFVERGKHIMPILLENNKRLKKDLLTRDEKIGSLEETVKNSQKAVAALRKQFSEITKHEVEKAKQDLKARLREARENGDIDEELEIREELDNVTAAAKKAQEEHDEAADDVTAPTTSQQKGMHPDFPVWQKLNPWFGKDQEKTDEFLKLAQQLRSESDLEGAEFFEEVKRQMPDNDPPQRGSKVESGTRSNSSSSKKSFASLPKEAKEACLADADMLVGDGKMYKNLDEWKSAYAKTYFELD